MMTVDRTMTRQLPAVNSQFVAPLGRDKLVLVKQRETWAQVVSQKDSFVRTKPIGTVFDPQKHKAAQREKWRQVTVF